MERSTSREMATKIVVTTATDHVGSNPNDRSLSSAICSWKTPALSQYTCHIIAYSHYKWQIPSLPIKIQENLWKVCDSPCWDSAWEATRKHLYGDLGMRCSRRMGICLLGWKRFGVWSLLLHWNKWEVSLFVCVADLRRSMLVSPLFRVEMFKTSNRAQVLPRFQTTIYIRQVAAVYIIYSAEGGTGLQIYILLVYRARYGYGCRAVKWAG